MTPSSQSFANRLSIKVMLTVLVVMLVFAVLICSITFVAIEAETEGRYKSITNLVNEKLNRIFTTVEINVRNANKEMHEALATPEEAVKVLEEQVKVSSDFIESYFLAFRPGYYPEYPQWFEPVMNKQHDKHPRNIGAPDHDYFKRDWYYKGIKSENGYWSAAYYDEVGSRDHVCSFVQPLYDKKDSLAGIFGADISLKWLAKELTIIDAENYQYGLTKFDTGKNYDFYTFIINSDGTYIAHPDWKRVMKRTVQEDIDSSDRDNIAKMTQRQQGKTVMNIDGIRAVVYYAPLESTDWTVAIVVPQMALWIPALSLIGLLLLVIIIVLVVIYFFFRYNINRVVSPLTALAHSADEVAKGNFAASLPHIEHHDEIGQLRDSFAAMQHSLEQYIQDIKVKTAMEAAISHDLDVAWKIQASMLPNVFPPFPERTDIDLYGYLKPAKSIGGDFYNFFIRDEKLFFCIGDVSGKGIPAALIMTWISGLFRLTSINNDDPKGIVEFMNNYLTPENKTSLFCTFFIGILDLKTLELNYCNAGHELPILITSEVSAVEVDHNLPLGVYEGLKYKSGQMQLAPGNVLVLYTDGLKDATNQDMELFGMERIKASLQTVVDGDQADAATYIHHLEDDVADFVKEAPQADDLTLMAIKVFNP